MGAIGNLNGDGLPEILVGASGNDAGGEDAGAAYIVWGKADGAPVDLVDVAAGTGGLKIIGHELTGVAGSIAAIGDLDGDGREEILVGAPSAATGAGAAYVGYSAADWLG